MIDELEKNIETEIEILREISTYTKKLVYANEQERELLMGTINSLKESMKLINRSIPGLLKNISFAKKLPSSKKERYTTLENINFNRIGSQVNVVLDVKDKEKFLKELSISERFVKKLRKGDLDKEEKYTEFKGARGYLKLGNRMFSKQSGEWVEKGYFKSLSLSLRKANINILFKSYISMIFLSVFLSLVFGVLLTVFLLFIEVSISFPFFGIYEGSYISRFIRIFWIPLVLPILVFMAIYFYPATEKKSIGKRIDQELPFAVIHMSAISGSGIEPSEIFRIIGLSKEYPYLRKEIRKVLNQINLYGYDLVTALSNAAKISPSENLSELFSGLSTTITSGSKLSDFLEKRSETLLLNYRLEREKYTKLVETFLDIYISVVIAAPMIFLLLLIMITVSGIGVGFTSVQLSLIAVFGISLLNIAFLIFLQIKQPTY